MERKDHPYMSYLNKPLLSILFIIIFHLVGLIGFMLPGRIDFFLSFVPFHLLLMALILLANQTDFNKNLWIGVFTFIAVGVMLEIAGVQTGVIFGHYHYGETLGFKIFEVPLIIGVNWMILIFSMGSVMDRCLELSKNLKAAVGAGILVVFDFLLEPVAIRFDYWSWDFGHIPVQNYIAWFLAAFLMLRVYEGFKFKKDNQTALTLLICQFVFFIILNLTVA